MNRLDIYTITYIPTIWMRRAKAVWFLKREQYQYFKVYGTAFNKEGAHWPTQL